MKLWLWLSALLTRKPVPELAVSHIDAQREINLRRSTVIARNDFYREHGCWPETRPDLIVDLSSLPKKDEWALAARRKLMLEMG